MSTTMTLDINDTYGKISPHPVELMPTWGYAASAFVLFLIGFFGFFLNLMVIILMCKDKQLWTPLNVILFNLVCSDFSVSILGNPFTLISALSHHWIFGKTMCVMYGFFMTLLGITSITTLTVLSFERYIMVSKPLTSHRLTMKGASYTVGLIWCYSLAVTTPPLFGWGKYVNEAANISCSINWEEQSTNALSYILFLFAMGLIFPVIIITFSYVNIIKTMKKNSVRMGRVQKAESRVTIMVLVMIITFMMAWTPYSILALIEQFAPRDLVSPGLGVIPALVAKSSICYDPIIYVGMNTQYRASLNRFFGNDDKEGSIQERGLDNTILSPTRGISQANTENNVTLQYMNPNDKIIQSVIMHQEEELDKTYDNNGMSKIHIIPNALEEISSELSIDSYVKDFSSSEISTPNIRETYYKPSTSSKKQRNSYDLMERNSIESDSNKMLLLRDGSDKDSGVDNIASSIMDECDFNRLLDANMSHRSKFEHDKNINKKCIHSQRRQTISSTGVVAKIIDGDMANTRKFSTSGIGFNYMMRRMSNSNDPRIVSDGDPEASELICFDDVNLN